ncbi:hypothetical protein LCGC14_1403520 [marine sediment metagenome]|uniref:Uncharacterized protein n=1 Tax=marine sediment metagenome TaxID=412755 RepID=A0A0F9KHA6_9ZZZZ
MPVVPATETLIDSRGARKTARPYPNPFFDLANNYIPSNIKTLFKFCKSFYYTNSFLRNVVTKLTEYPITDILYDEPLDEHWQNRLNDILHKQIKIKSFLIEIGLDYFTYGNAFITASMKPKRFLKCGVCGHEELIDNVKFKLKKYSFVGICKECGAQEVPMVPKDEEIASIKNFRLHRWSPENIDIEYNSITGTSSYFYTIPARVKRQITSGNVTVLRDIPLVFLESLRTRKKIEISSDNLFHFKYPTLAEEDMGWGKPIILPALKDIYYLQTLKRGNEAIANEHIVPKKCVFPANTTTLDPYTQMNLGVWRSKIEEQIEKWKSDPNNIAIFPIPMGYQELGGNARMLLLTPELKFLEENIINSLGVPLEFIKGGASWTGSSVSLRIVENHFLGYRELLTDFLNYFVMDRLNAFLKIPAVKLKFKKFKMNDDSEAKALSIELNAAGKISDFTLLSEFGLDPEKEVEANKAMRETLTEEQIKAGEMQAEAAGKAMVIQARYQVRAQRAANDERLKIQAELFQEELVKENIGIPEDPMKLVDKYAMEIFYMEPETQQTYLNKMSEDMPITYRLVLDRLNMYQSELYNLPMIGDQMESPAMMEEQGATTQPPAPKERKKITVKKQGEKTKGATRGQP